MRIGAVSSACRTVTALELDEDSATLEGTGYLTEETDATLNELISSARRDSDLAADESRYDEPREVSWLDPGRFTLKRAKK